MEDMSLSEQFKAVQNRQRTKSESCVYSKILRRSSQQFSSIENLESLITCSIHLGLINEPRQLPCGHAFCYSCLKNYLKHISQPKSECITCPLCRYETTLDDHGLDVLAPSIVHKQLTEYLIIKRQRLLDNSLERNDAPLTHYSNLNEIKLELMRYLMKDFKKEISNDSKNHLEEQLNSIFKEHNGPISKPKTRVRSLSDSTCRKVLSKKSDAYHHLDETSIKKNMRKYREYKLIRSFTHPEQSEILQVSWIDTAGSIDCSEDAEVMMYITKNSSLIYFSNLNGTKLRNFSLIIDGHSPSPFFVKSQDEVLLIVGRYQQQSVLMKVSLDGEVINLSKTYPGDLGGFCVDNVNGSIIVAYPSQHAVLILDKESLEDLKTFNFDDLSPLYVAKSSNSREIWVSCPDNGRIAVYDEVHDNYLHLDTSQIYGSVPTHINETKDHRILFLDATWSRVFWIRRWNNQLYIQLLIVFGVNEDMAINSVEPMSENMLMLSNNEWTYIAKPTRSVKEEHMKGKCVLL